MKALDRAMVFFTICGGLVLLGLALLLGCALGEAAGFWNNGLLTK